MKEICFPGGEGVDGRGRGKDKYEIVDALARELAREKRLHEYPTRRVYSCCRSHDSEG